MSIFSLFPAMTAWTNATANVWHAVLAPMSEVTMLIIWGGLLISLSRAVQARLAAPSPRTPERASAAFGSPLHQPGTRLGARV